MIARENIDYTSWTQLKGVLPNDAGWTPDQQIQVATDLGLAGIELFDAQKSLALKDAGLINPLLMPNYDNFAPFAIGLGSGDLVWDLVVKQTKQLVEVAKQNGFPGVIAFTGMGKATETAKELCIWRLVELSNIVGNSGVKINLEHLNNVDFKTGVLDGMKGHPGYMGNQLEWVADVVREARKHGANSAHLLFDVYHVEIMHPGRVIELLKAHHDIIGHIHFANPRGRSELYLDSPIDLGKIADEISNIGYNGYTGIEFVPTESDLRKGLEQSLRVLTGES